MEPSITVCFVTRICNHVLEHIIEDKKAMCEILRVLKIGGKAILQVPISLSLEKSHEDYSITNEKEREQIYGQFDHVRLYGQDYKEKLELAGFKVAKIAPEELIVDTIRFGVDKNEYLYVCSK